MVSEHRRFVGRGWPTAWQVVKDSPELSRAKADAEARVEARQARVAELKRKVEQEGQQAHGENDWTPRASDCSQGQELPTAAKRD